MTAHTASVATDTLSALSATTLAEYRDRLGLLSTDTLLSTYHLAIVEMSLAEFDSEAFHLANMKVDYARREVRERMTD